MSAVLIRFCLVLLHVCGSSEGLEVIAEPGQNVTVRPGDDVNLRCGDPNITNNKDLVFEWIRTDLKEENVFFYRNNKPVLDNQHESFQNRVFLKNVTVNDNGTYECRVLKGLSADQNPLISTINLLVSPPERNIIAESGDDVTLRCEDTNINEDLVLNWTRTDLKKNRGYVSFRMKTPAEPEGQPESFKDRVSLKNSQMKDGDLSVVLENVTINDNGTYECRIEHGKGSRRKRSAGQTPPISTIHLQVFPPPPPLPGDGGGGNGENKDDETKKPEGLSGGVIAGITVGGLVVVVLVLYRICNNPCCRPFEPNNQQPQILIRVRNIDGEASEDTENKKLRQRKFLSSSSQSS